MRDKRIYTKCIAISEKDLSYVKSLKVQEAKSVAGALSFVIKFFRKNGEKKSTDII